MTERGQPLPAALAFYAEPAPLSDPGPHRAPIAELPDDVPALCAVIQGLLIHRNWAAAYGWEMPDERQQDAQARSARAIFDRILTLDAGPLTAPREPAARFAGTCRDFTLMLTTMLRVRGVPARARCGFGRYFKPGSFEDHWVCEHWDAARQRWVLTDAQLDPLQREALDLPFDPQDVPRDQFIVAGEAWRLCRTGAEDPETFGIFDMHGLWFVRGNVLRDLAALNRAEVLPWDDFGMLLEIPPSAEPSSEQTNLLDEAAALSREPDFDALRALYAAEPSLCVGEKVKNWQTQADEAIPQ